MTADGWTQISSLVEWWLTGRENKVLCGKPVPVSFCDESSWNVMAHGDAREGKCRGNWRMEWVASTLHTTSERGVSCITTADTHTSAASSRLNWHPCQFKWTCPFRQKTKSGFCACAITFQTQSTINNAWTARGSNAALYGEKRGTDHLSYGMAVKGRMTGSVTSDCLHVTIL